MKFVIGKYLYKSGILVCKRTAINVERIPFDRRRFFGFNAGYSIV